MQWYRKAADQGDADAYVGIGIMYADGLGVEKSLAEAGHWFRKAADDKNPDGEFYLGLAYLKGGIAPSRQEGSAVAVAALPGCIVDASPPWLAQPHSVSATSAAPTQSNERRNQRRRL